MQSIDRRVFLKASVACACCSIALANNQDEQAPTDIVLEDPVDVGSIDDFKEPGIYDAHARRAKIMLARIENTLIAYSSLCTHKSCVLKKAKDGLRCPCHFSEFDIDGTFLDGKANRSLNHFAIQNRDGRVLVDRREQFEEADWGDEKAVLKLA